MAEKPFETGDPFSLEARPIPGGDADLMAASFIEEFARMGLGEAEILDLFRRPDYRATHLYYRGRGEAATRALIRGTLAHCGVWRVSEGRERRHPPCIDPAAPEVA